MNVPPNPKCLEAASLPSVSTGRDSSAPRSAQLAVAPSEPSRSPRLARAAANLRPHLVEPRASYCAVGLRFCRVVIHVIGNRDRLLRKTRRQRRSAGCHHQRAEQRNEPQNPT